jgi:cytochrome P450
MSQSFKIEPPRGGQHAGMNHSISTPAEPPPDRSVHPPGPPDRWWGLPLLRRMRADYLGFAAELQRAHGDISRMRLGFDQAYDLFSPELVREALVDNADGLIRWERGIEVFEQVFGQSVLVTEGTTWQRQRRMLQAAFTPRKVAGYAELMADAARDALDAAVPPGDLQARVDMDALFTRLTMDVILRTLFSSRADDQARAAMQATQHLSEVALREMFLPFTLPDSWPLPGKAAKRRALRTLRGLVGAQIAARRQQPQPEAQDLLAMLLALRDEPSGEPLTEAEVFDQCMVSFQAGHETSAVALLWWSHLMASHPEAAARARAEVDGVLAGRPPQAAHAAGLPWLNATLKEAMRLYPPVAAIMTRRTVRPMTLGGWTIPARAMLRITPWLLQRDPRWFELPEAFRPERFLPGAPAPERGAWMPFGAGPRVCLGQHFAMLEMTLVAALLLQRYTLAPVPNGPAPKPVLQVTLRPDRPLHLLLQRRREGTGGTP